MSRPRTMAVVSICAALSAVSTPAQTPQARPEPTATAEVPAAPAAAVEDDVFVPPPDLATGWYARFETDLGRFVVRLLPYQAPQSVAHFAALAEGRLGWYDPVTGEEYKQPYYDGTLVAKAVAAERFEAGETTAEGRMAPVLFVPEEGAGPVNFYLPYRMGMTRASGGRISAVKFFVTAASQPFLTPRHPCFGEVVDGQDVVYRITTSKTYSNQRPIEPIVLEQVRIFKVGEPDPLPEPVPYVPEPKRMELRKDRRNPG